MPYAQKLEIDKQMENMLQDGIVVPSRSAWSSPFLLVPKKLDAAGNKRWRIVS